MLLTTCARKQERRGEVWSERGKKEEIFSQLRERAYHKQVFVFKEIHSIE